MSAVQASLAIASSGSPSSFTSFLTLDWTAAKAARHIRDAGGLVLGLHRSTPVLPRIVPDELVHRIAGLGHLPHQRHHRRKLGPELADRSLALLRGAAVLGRPLLARIGPGPGRAEPGPASQRCLPPPFAAFWRLT